MQEIIKNTLDFGFKYYKSYLTALFKPILTAFVGLVLLFLCFLNPILILVSLLSIPCLCWAFWRGFVITYALIPACDDYLKTKNTDFQKHIKYANENQYSLAFYVLFITIIYIILYIPVDYYFIHNLFQGDFSNFINEAMTYDDVYSLKQYFSNATLKAIKSTALMLNITMVISAPLLNYWLVALFYKKEKENYINLLLNCYLKLNIIGILIALLITFFTFKFIVVYLISAIFINPFIYGINTVWYQKRFDKK